MESMSPLSARLNLDGEVRDITEEDALLLDVLPAFYVFLGGECRAECVGLPVFMSRQATRKAHSLTLTETLCLISDSSSRKLIIKTALLLVVYASPSPSPSSSPSASSRFSKWCLMRVAADSVMGLPLPMTPTRPSGPSGTEKMLFLALTPFLPRWKFCHELLRLLSSVSVWRFLNWALISLMRFRF